MVGQGITVVRIQVESPGMIIHITGLRIIIIVIVVIGIIITVPVRIWRPGIV